MRYGEEETSAILRRAAELQARRTFQNPDAERGLTLAEIEQAAADVGIRPEFIRAAVAEKQMPRSRVVPAGVTEIHRTVAGPITESVWRDMVDALQQSFGKVGFATRSGDTFEWQLKSDPDPHTRAAVHVIVHSRETGSEIILRGSERQAVRRGWVIGVLASLFLSFWLTMLCGVSARYLTMTDFWILMAIFNSPLLAGTGLAIKQWVRRDRKKLTQVMDLLGYVARGATVTEAPYSTLPASNPEPQMLTLGRSG